MGSCITSRLARCLLSLLTWVVIVSAQAADELLVYAFANGEPAVGAEVLIGDQSVGTTTSDGSLLADLGGSGARVLSIQSESGSVTQRFSAGAGQLVDAVAQLDQGAVFIDVYSQTESISERKAATEGTLVVNVEQGGAPASEQSIYVAGSGAALKTDSSGNATLTLPRGRYRTQIAEKTVNLRVVGGLTRAVSVSIAEEGETMQIAAPEIEEVFVVASFDPAGLEVSERDTANIVDTIGVELLT